MYIYIYTRVRVRRGQNRFPLFTGCTRSGGHLRSLGILFFVPRSTSVGASFGLGCRLHRCQFAYILEATRSLSWSISTETPQTTRARAYLGTFVGRKRGLCCAAACLDYLSSALFAHDENHLKSLYFTGFLACRLSSVAFYRLA